MSWTGLELTTAKGGLEILVLFLHLFKFWGYRHALLIWFMQCWKSNPGLPAYHTMVHSRARSATQELYFPDLGMKVINRVLHLHTRALCSVLITIIKKRDTHMMFYTPISVRLKPPAHSCLIQKDPLLSLQIPATQRISKQRKGTKNSPLLHS